MLGLQRIPDVHHTDAAQGDVHHSAASLPNALDHLVAQAQKTFPSNGTAIWTNVVEPNRSMPLSLLQGSSSSVGALIFVTAAFFLLGVGLILAVAMFSSDPAASLMS